jgi:hypothetical protein
LGRLAITFFPPSLAAFWDGARLCGEALSTRIASALAFSWEAIVEYIECAVLLSIPSMHQVLAFLHNARQLTQSWQK